MQGIEHIYRYIDQILHYSSDGMVVLELLVVVLNEAPNNMRIKKLFNSSRKDQ